MIDAVAALFLWGPMAMFHVETQGAFCLLKKDRQSPFSSPQFQEV